LILLLGGHIKSFDHLDFLQEHGFDFGELVIANDKVRRFWLKSGIRNRFDCDFFMLAHGPFEGPPNDLHNLTDRYLPSLLDAVDATASMEMRLLTVHMYVDSRFVTREIIEEKTKALADLVEYGRERGVGINLENLSERARDLVRVLAAVPGLGITLDVGHGQILTRTNTSFQIIKKLGHRIRHLHLHDNSGGTSHHDDLHLPIGDGKINFPKIIGRLLKSGYDGTATLELEKDDLLESRARVNAMIEGR
jgi:sugar phosphate isomerase/epimerase